MVHDLLPFALGGVERRRDRLLAIHMVARDAEDLPSGTGHAAPQSMDQGSASLLTVETRNNLRSASVRTYTFFTTG
jgi:hypothetical protein